MTVARLTKGRQSAAVMRPYSRAVVCPPPLERDLVGGCPDSQRAWRGGGVPGPDETRVVRSGQLAFDDGLAELQAEPAFRNPLFLARCREGLVDLAATTEGNDSGDRSFGDLVGENLCGRVDVEGELAAFQPSQEPRIDLQGDSGSGIPFKLELCGPRPQSQLFFTAGNDQS